jgi:hypothetical protein
MLYSTKRKKAFPSRCLLHLALGCTKTLSSFSKFNINPLASLILGFENKLAHYFSYYDVSCHLRLKTLNMETASPQIRHTAVDPTSL